ncbi:MAG TPA: type I phosphomannose isomerase catalytic subunit [Ktedonobacteraceae bacterium]|nr:type I phosphomannose isomerase catalytic subunit [Ktedonobacteraceae bacterium]
MQHIYPIRLEASLHETIWGGRKLEQACWKNLPAGDAPIGEAWETEVSTRVQNGPYQGQTLGEVVEKLGPMLLGTGAMAIFGPRFPLLAKFIDARAKLSVQVHPHDQYAHQHEHGKLGKTEFWYILAAEPEASIIHGFKIPGTRKQIQDAIARIRLEELLHEEQVAPGDIIFVPAGTVHAIGAGVLLYELQEYSDVTYRMYDYGRLDAQGRPRELHVERSLEVALYEPSARIKVQPVTLVENKAYRERCLVACRYFVVREIVLHTQMEGYTDGSCLILTSLGAHLHVRYGEHLAQSEELARGQTMVLPATLGNYLIAGEGTFLVSYVPAPEDDAWQRWKEQNDQILFSK